MLRREMDPTPSRRPRKPSPSCVHNRGYEPNDRNNVMARNYAQITTAIWADRDFRALDTEAQRLYLFLVSQPDVSLVGVLHVRSGSWARCAADQSRGSVEYTLTTLSRTGMVEWDRDDEEVWIRGFIRHNVTGSPKAILGASRAFGAVISERLSERILEEIHPDLRVPFSTEFDGLDFGEVRALIDGLSPWVPPPKTPSDTPYPDPPNRPSQGVSDALSDGVSDTLLDEISGPISQKPPLTCENVKSAEPKNRVSHTPSPTETGDLRPETGNPDLHRLRKHGGCEPAVLDDDEVDQQSRRAARELAKRELGNLAHRPDNVDAYVATVAKAKLDEHGDQLQTLIWSGLSATEAAEQVATETKSDLDKFLANLGTGRKSSTEIEDRVAAAQLKNMRLNDERRRAEHDRPAETEEEHARGLDLAQQARNSLRVDRGVNDLEGPR